MRFLIICEFFYTLDSFCLEFGVLLVPTCDLFVSSSSFYKLYILPLKKT
jgi:hypothetical protein